MTKARDLANGGFGLVLIKPSTVVNGTDNGKGTVSFSAASTVSLNDVFSATYSNYLIHLTQSGSQTNDVNMRMRVSGSDNSSANYIRSYLSQNSTTLLGQAINGETSFRAVAQMRSGQENFSQMTMINPFATANTTIIQDSTDQVGSNSFFQLRIMHTLSVTTSYTGFTLIAAGGNITGSVSVYGYNK